MLTRPSVSNLVRILGAVQLGDLIPHGCACGRHILAVQHQHQCPVERGRRTGPVLGRVSRVEGPVRVVAPLVGLRRSADDRVLVEIQQILILENGQVGVADSIELAKPKSISKSSPQGQVTSNTPLCQ